MGYRIENYTREDLKRISLPGQAVSTLFWALPLGRWKLGELDKWWSHFTERAGPCHDLGLLLVRDLKDNSQTITRDTTNLTPLTNSEGGRLGDLIPEIAQHWNASADYSSQEHSILLLSGGYPQPGWGVLITGDALQNPRTFERLIEDAIQQCGSEQDLRPITMAATAYHRRASAMSSRPVAPDEPRELGQLRKASDDLNALFQALDDTSYTQLQGTFDRVRKIKFSDILDEGANVSDDAMNDLGQYVGVFKGIPTALSEQQDTLSQLVQDFDACDEAEYNTFYRNHSSQQAAFLRSLRLLRKQWPELQVDGLSTWFQTTFYPYVKTRFHDVLGIQKARIERKIAELSVDLETRRQRYNIEKQNWEGNIRAAESTFRNSLAEASLAQWRLGPSFLNSLESRAQPQASVKSVPWDPPRMIGWKLHLTEPEIDPHDLLVAANSVLGTDTSQMGAGLPSGKFSGSLFADYVYFVAMTAPRLSPWEATRRLLTELLSAGQLRKMAGTSSADTLFTTTKTKEQIVEDLLHQWGWMERRADAPRSLAACLTNDVTGKLTLSKSLNDTRISLESFLKDLVWIALSTLGWNEAETDDKIAVHCPSYHRGSRGPWRKEMEKLTSGGALILLRDLLGLAFPSSTRDSTVENLCKASKEALDALNPGSHDPPPPPPSLFQLNEYGKTIKYILDMVRLIVGEMPWHLRPTQVFGSEPMIATGYAWSHSHIEERMIRVMLWAGERSASELLVWNRTLTNPVMTDAILLGFTH